MIIFSLKLLILLYISSKSISFTLPPIHETLKYNNKHKKIVFDNNNCVGLRALTAVPLGLVF